ncbi:SsgA family sporulation/cell division regulator [Umezawaea sp.]|uniref:SsgA family sporulation/cell division regulator n=1 Tax=Umezawaea sp. TaxID=1955258 RepID=UPI002ED6490C
MAFNISVTSTVAAGLALSGGEASIGFVTFAYDTEDPLAVTVSTTTDLGSRSWTVERDRLDDGLLVGCETTAMSIARGDADHFALGLRAGGEPEVTAVIATAEVVDFLNLSYDIVALGQEMRWVDVDRELLET